MELLKKIQAIDIFKHLGLVGGTSLTLQIGHRISDDLDLFGNIETEHLEIVNSLNNLGKLKTIRHSQNIHIFTINDIKIDIVNYKYNWIENEIIEKNIKLAKLKDIAAMKISAITGRGTKKDFIDLFFLLKRFSLQELLDFYQQKYYDGSLFLALKSLTYFNDADIEPMPIMFTDINWELVKKNILFHVKNFID